MYIKVNKVHKLTQNAQKSHTTCTKSAMAVKCAICNVMSGQWVYRHWQQGELTVRVEDSIISKSWTGFKKEGKWVERVLVNLPTLGGMIRQLGLPAPWNINVSRSMKIDVFKSEKAVKQCSNLSTSDRRDNSLKYVNLLFSI